MLYRVITGSTSLGDSVQEGVDPPLGNAEKHIDKHSVTFKCLNRWQFYIVVSFRSLL